MRQQRLPACTSRVGHEPPSGSTPGSTEVGKANTSPAGANEENGESAESKTSPSGSKVSESSVGGDVVAPIHKLLDRYWNDQISLSFEERTLIELCEEDYEILEFMESLNEAEVSRLLSDKSRLRRFLEVAASEQYDKFQLTGDMGQQCAVSNQNLRDALEAD